MTKPLPVTRHPAFPLVTALWFAALVGALCLVLRIGAFERMDMQAQLGLALVLATIGGQGGLALGRALAILHARPAPATRRRHAATPVSLSGITLPEARDPAESLSLAKLTERLTQACPQAAHAPLRLAGRGEDYLAEEQASASLAAYAALLARRLDSKPAASRPAMPPESEEALHRALSLLKGKG